MDIAGAKALKKRLAANGADKADEATAVPAAEVAEDAPPVYHWTGVRQATPEPEPAEGEADDPPVERAVAMFRRLVLSFR
jgi:hypothetical protein